MRFFFFFSFHPPSCAAVIASSLLPPAARERERGRHRKIERGREPWRDGKVGRGWGSKHNQHLLPGEEKRCVQERRGWAV